MDPLGPWWETPLRGLAEVARAVVEGSVRAGVEGSARAGVEGSECVLDARNGATLRVGGTAGVVRVVEGSVRAGAKGLDPSDCVFDAGTGAPLRAGGMVLVPGPATRTASA